jgi:hypothetical protein
LCRKIIEAARTAFSCYPYDPALTHPSKNSPARYECHQEQHNKYYEEYARDFRGSSGDAEKTQCSGDQGNY